MTTSPAVSETHGASGTATNNLSMGSLILAMVIAVLICIAAIGGGLFYMARSGRLSLQKSATVSAEVAPSPVALTSHAMQLEPLVANLADAGSAAYLKLSLTLRVADVVGKKAAAASEEKPAKGVNEAEAAVRDTVLTVLGQQTAGALLAADGKERLKSELKAALLAHNPELKVMDLYFTDFLVQR